MAIKDVFKVSFKTFFNPRAWLGYDELKANTRTTWSILKGLLTPDKPTREETFEEGMKRFNLTETEVEEKKTIYLAYSYIFVGFAIASILAGIYFLFQHKTVSAFLLAFAASTLFLSQAFRYHFWYFQIKHRKLGCTFEEWRKGKLLNEEEKP